MKHSLISLLFVFLLPTHAFGVDCSEKYDSNGLSFPMKSYDNYVFVPEKACLNGKDITDFVGEGGVISSVVKVENAEVFYITTHHSKGAYDKFSAVFQLENGKVFKQNFFNYSPYAASSHKSSLKGMVVNYYDNKNEVAYLTTDMGTIHFVKFNRGNLVSVWYSTFLTDGEFFGSNGGNIYVRKGTSKKKYVVMIDEKGKEVCKVETDKELWQLTPVCM
ncbi:hypothetical protein L0Y26_08700 [Pectobacterium aroidearum]|uniref:hypothetical protein n=1 Tax=Pectobacterium aroidearum TaxID=1201031 RepID=UPI0021142B58|nr:hypothetical protein [Pectobacterium aroidearum]UUE37972.1 hypothetical protein L0Y26_08700 [Pectobacterium aroidearum]UUE42347.1 hypothetical protein L0Y25_08700 [Pectobacterium aroidearum]